MQAIPRWCTTQSDVTSALPMALLTSIVRKEALLPVHTAAFAATQLLPVIQAAVRRQLDARGRGFPSDVCKELLVSADASTSVGSLPAWPHHVCSTMVEELLCKLLACCLLTCMQ